MLRHHWTEYQISGTSTKATIAVTADQTARRSGSSTKRRNARYPAYATSRIAAVVNRGSQAHQTPQVGRPQMEPRLIPTAPNSTPTSAEASASASVFQLFLNKYATEQPKFSVAARSAIQTCGTWTYMIRCTSPISRSGGAHASASQAPTPSIATATMKIAQRTRFMPIPRRPAETAQRPGPNRPG